MSAFVFALWVVFWLFTVFIAVGVTENLLSQPSRIHLVESVLVLCTTAIFIWGLTSVS